jgi:hypothetical protein
MTYYKDTNNVQAKGSEDDYKKRLLAVEEKRVKIPLALIAQSQIGKNEAIIKLAMAKSNLALNPVNAFP